MSLKATWHKHTLNFRFEAGTSRGVYTEKDTYFIKIFDESNPQVFGLGECGILKDLSIDDLPNFEEILEDTCQTVNNLDLEVFPWNLNIIINQLIDSDLPAVRFGFETALLDFMNGCKRVLFNNDFTNAKKSILINGLIWMGKPEFMLQQIEDKLKTGYTTLKMKIGAIDFGQELAILKKIRSEFSAEQITIRVDANGAFLPDEVHGCLSQLAEYQIHSIEQPVRAKQLDLMTELCKTSPIPIALDEELIGVNDYFQKMSLLKKIQPQYIILKPTLLGGLQSCREWIEIAGRMHIGWWITSALESNVGLNAIAQFTAEYKNTLPQGLGTGQLYHNNIESPLTIESGFLKYDNAKSWDLTLINA
jgi:o-succinylbenzoate synthase